MKKRVILFICALLLFSLSMPYASAANSKIVFSKSNQQTKKIALTFDDGPHPRYTEKILSILKKYNIKATFFVIGVNIENYPDELEQIYAEGHEIGNHSYSHATEKNFNDESVREELKKCEDLIYNKIGIKPKLFRPPQGAYSANVERVAFNKGYSIVLWSIDTKDWAHNTPQSIMNIVSDNLRGGDVILMHDYTSGKNTTCEALEIMIPYLLEKGYEFVTVSELMEI